MTILRVLLLSLLASPGYAECVVTKSEESEVRVKCEFDGQIIEQGNLERNGKRFLSERKRRWFGWKTWQETEVPELPDELPPIPVQLPTEPISFSESVANDGPVIHNVGIFYTANAEKAQGGFAAMQSLCTQAVAVANQTYVNSKINLQLVLKTCSLVNYTEQPSNISSDLSRFRLTADGHMDTVHALRNSLGIDIMTLFGQGYSSNGACGVGYLMSNPSLAFASSAFNVVDRSCAVGRPSYGHEVGHNQGLHHNPTDACGSSICNGYNYGHHASNFGTMMSYIGSRIRYISNPLVLYNNVATGIANQRDNARRLSETMTIVSNFRTEFSKQLEKPTGDRIK